MITKVNIQEGRQNANLMFVAIEEAEGKMAIARVNSSRTLK